MGRQPRQRPISCHLCRVRKLRCSRVFPCSNCTSRGVVCQHEGVASAPNAAAAAAAAAGQHHRATSSSGKDVSASDLLSRLERLENLLAAQERNREQSAKPRAYPEPTTITATATTATTTATAARPATATATAQATAAASPPVPPRLQRLTADALELERSCSDQRLMDSLISEPIVFRVCPIRLTTSQPSYIFQNGVPAMSGPMEVIKCIWLPRREEMRIIVQKYLSDISYFHHIIHTPSLVSLVEEIYNGVDQNTRIDLGGVLLLLSILSSTTYGWAAPDDARCLFSNTAEANSQSTFWIKEALDVVDQAHRTAHASLECIQALIILFFTFCNHESVSQRARNVLMLAISTATELSLHRLDEPRSSTSPNIRMSEARKEVGRRVWWYLVATDWMLAHFSTPQEGFYLINKHQMTVNKPRNVHDEDIIEGMDIVELPVSEPTCISYFIQRIKLAEVCQALLDQNPVSAPVLDPTTYKNVLESDAQLNKIMREMPDFLSLDNSSINNLSPTDLRRSPLITIQRYILNLLLHRQLCKIHLPYLAHGTVDPTYSYSRDVCLRSARVVIELDHQIQEQHLPFGTSRLRLTMVLRSIFLASIALVLNACLKTGTEGSDVEVEDEVVDAWKILHEAQGQSPTASKLLELSVQILRKYKIRHQALDLLQQQVEGLSPNGEGLPMTPDSAHQDPRMGGASQNVPPQLDALLEQQWQMLEGRMDLNGIDWDKIFWGLDAPFI